jgi:hypothetical protein
MWGIVDFSFFSRLHKACKRAPFLFSKKQLLAATCSSSNLQPCAATWGKCLRAAAKWLPEQVASKWLPEQVVAK